MLLIGVDYHRSFQTIAFFVEETGEYDERRLTIVVEKQSRSIEACSRRESACVSAWRPLDTHAGSNGCWQSWASRYGSAIRND
jgi:hypothetical protein